MEWMVMGTTLKLPIHCPLILTTPKADHVQQQWESSVRKPEDWQSPFQTIFLLGIAE